MSEQIAPLYTDRAGFLAKVAEIRETNASLPDVKTAVDETVKDVLTLLDQPNITLIAYPDESKGEILDPVQINNGDDTLVNALFGVINS